MTEGEVGLRNLIYSLATLLLVAVGNYGCGCPAVDMSREIVLNSLSSTLEVASSEDGLSATEATAVTAAMTRWTERVAVGYWHNHSCHTKPWHEADFVTYYSANPTSSPYWRDNIIFDGEYAIDRVSPTYSMDGISELELIGTFRADTTQSALNQQFPPHDKGKHILVEEQARLQVPIVWQAQGTINGKVFNSTFVTIYVVELY